MNKLRVEEIIIVEGKYDAAKVSQAVDGLILTTDGFSIFSNSELRNLIKELGKKRGILVLTDSDSAGFKIRTYINNFARNLAIKNAYIPSVLGKESRKPLPSKEGLVGVEGMDINSIVLAIKNAGISQKIERAGRGITYSDLYELGLSGTYNCAYKRRELLNKIGLPIRLSKKALCEVINSLFTYDEFCKICENI